MKLIALPDLHEALSAVDALAEVLAQVDGVLLVGDMTNATGAGGVARVLQTIRRFNPHILAIPGNWETADAIQALTDEGINLHGRLHMIAPFAFLGIGGALPSPMPTPNELSEAMFAQVTTALQAQLPPLVPSVVLCHQPPYGTRMDRTWTHLHVGSHVIRTFLETVQPLVCFTGHIHEGIGMEMVGQTMVVNPGPLWQGHYAYAHLNQTDVHVEIRALPTENAMRV